MKEISSKKKKRIGQLKERNKKKREIIERPGYFWDWKRQYFSVFH